MSKQAQSCSAQRPEACALRQVHDRMTEEVYAQPLRSFRSSARPAPVFTVPVLARGRAALEEINKELGLAFDEQARAWLPDAQLLDIVC